MAEVARPPDCITLAEHRDNRHRLERALRWGVVTALTALALAGVANVFGQRDSETLATGESGATLALTAPAALRSGLLFQATFRIHAEREIGKPTLVLDEGWFDGISVNAVVPEPTGAASRGGRVAFMFPTLPAGRTMTVYVDFQVNPTTAGRRRQGAELRDRDRTIASIERHVNVFP